ncbi:MAG: class I SAM-dependent methyltransferase [Candidatus Woesearchaeota archaeon]
MASDRVKRVSSEMADFYNSSDAYLKMLAAHDDLYLPKYVQYVQKFVKPGSKIIDIGCGRGNSTALFSKTYDVIGADLSRKFIAYAKKNYKGAKFRVCSALDLPFPDSSFDAAVSYGVIEHITDVPKYLDEAMRVTKPGGCVIVVAPNLTSPLRPILAFFSAKGYVGFTSSRLQTFGWLVRSIGWSFSKWLAAKPRFIYRKPLLNASGPDADATYVSNPYDIKKYLISKGFEVVGLSPNTFSLNFLPVIPPHIGVVAIKKLSPFA